MNKIMCPGDLIFATQSKRWYCVIKSEQLVSKQNHTWNNAYSIDCYALDTNALIKGWFLLSQNLGLSHLLYRDGKLV